MVVGGDGGRPRSPAKERTRVWAAVGCGALKEKEKDKDENGRRRERKGYDVCVCRSGTIYK